MPLKTTPRLLNAIVLLLILLAACTPQQQVTSTLPVEAAPTAVPVTPTATAEPNVVWLIAMVDPMVSQRAEIQAFLTERAPIDGYTLEVKEAFDSTNVPGGLRIVVFLSPVEDIASLAASFPETEFVVIADTDLPPGENLSVIYTNHNREVFLAGYLATLNAPDFRSGALIVDGTARTAQLQDSFLNGGRYFCGRCAPVYAPIVLFPQVGLVPAGTDAAGWQAAFDLLNQNTIETLYLPAEALLPEFLGYLSGKNVTIISEAPPLAGSEAIWMASVQPDARAVLEHIWPPLTAGNGGKALQAGPVLTNVNPANLSSGRQQLAERIIPDLTSGAISPLTVP